MTGASVQFERQVGVSAGLRVNEWIVVDKQVVQEVDCSPAASTIVHHRVFMRKTKHMMSRNERHEEYMRERRLK